MNSDLGMPIAVGRTAEIFPWEKGKILKLFFNWFDLQDIEYEQRINSSVHSSGLPVPDVGAIIQVNGRNGLIYDRVEGVNMWSCLGRQPWRLCEFARLTAQLHVEMHTNTTQLNIPSQRRKLIYKINAANMLPADTKEKALAELSSLPDGNSICHGDFHPGNILISATSIVVIDWIDSSIGNPLADVARTSVIALGAAKSPGLLRGILPQLLVLFHNMYIRHYFRLRPGGEEEYRRWIPVVAAGRLNENIREQEKWLLATASDI